MIGQAKSKIKKGIHSIKAFSIMNRLIVYILVSMLISLSLFGFFIYYNMYRNMMETAYDDISLRIEQVSNNLDESFQIINFTALGLAYTGTVKEWISDPSYFVSLENKNNAKEIIFDEEIRKSIVFDGAYNLGLITSLSAYVNEKPVSFLLAKNVSLEKERLNADKALEAFKIQRDKNKKYVITLYPTSANNTIYHIRQLTNPYDYSQTITYVIGTNEETIWGKLRELMLYDDIEIYLYNKEGHILSSNRKALLGQSITDPLLAYDRAASRPVIETFGKYIVGHNSLEKSELQVAVKLPKRIIVLKVLSEMSYFILFSILLMVIITGVVLILMMNSTRYIKDLLICIKAIKNKQYDQKMPSYKNQSANELSIAVNSMTEDLSYLIKEVYEKQLLIKEMNIKFLQHQMNPHFLFNILLTIQMKAKSCQDESIYKMVNSLTTLLRAGVYTESMPKIKLRQELEYVEFYLYLQQVRFEERLTYTIDIEDEHLLESMVPKLSVEPMVENSIIHGLENKIGHMKVDVVVKQSENNLCIEIIDNGCGFDLEKLNGEMIDQVINRHEKPSKIGIKNTDERLKLIYGQDYGLQIKSQIGEGTSIRMLMPLDT